MPKQWMMALKVYSSFLGIQQSRNFAPPRQAPKLKFFKILILKFKNSFKNE